jgi:ABC-2 type transport system permease protein
MRLKAFLKITLIGLKRDFPIMIFSFAVFPIVLSTLYGYFQSELFVPSNRMEKISITIKDKDRTKAATELAKFLKSPGISQYIEVKNAKAELDLVIPNGYEASFRNNKSVNLAVEYQDEKVDSKAAMVSALLDRYNERLQEQVNIQNRINTLSIANKEALLKDISVKMYNIENTSSIKNVILPKENSLTSYEYYSASVFSFMFIVVIMSLVAGYYNEKETGVFKRIISASLSKYQYFNYSLVCYFVFALLINIVYVTAFRIMGLSFGGSVGLLGLIVIGKSLMEAAVSGMVIAFFKSKMVATMFLNVFIMLAVTIGGAFAPVEKMGGAILVTISKFLPNTLVINTFKNYLLHDSLSSIALQLFAFVGISVLMYAISIAKISIKWEA